MPVDSTLNELRAKVRELQLTRRHRIFVVNTEKAQCVDCRRDFELPSISSMSGSTPDERAKWTEEQWKAFHVLRAELLVPGYVYSPWSKVGFCTVKLLTYVNTSGHTLNLSGLGIPVVLPGEVFTMGDATSPKAVCKTAPQVKWISSIDRKNTGLDLMPLTVHELIYFTTHTEGLLHHAGFVSPRA